MKKLIKNDKEKTSRMGTVRGKVALSQYERIKKCLDSERVFEGKLGETVRVEYGADTALFPWGVIKLINSLTDEGLKLRTLNNAEIVRRAALLLNPPGQPQEPVKLEVVAPENEAVELVDEGQPTTPLTEEEKNELQAHEKAIQKGWATIVEASMALMEIQSKKLYREHFKTFEDYCKKRWEMARSSAYQRINFARTFQDLSAMADIVKPVSERQVRALADLSAEDKQRVWREAVQNQPDGTPSYKDVKQARNRLGLGKAAPTESKSKPEADETSNATETSDTGVTDFKPKARWLAFKKILEQEHESWPPDCRAILVKNLQTCVDEWHEAAK